MAKGIFLELPVDQIERIRDQAVAAIQAGTIQTGWSIGENSATKMLALTPAEILDECRYALKRLAPEKYGAPINRTLARFN